MIQEILDYCLIKNQLITSTKEEILAQLQTERDLEIWFSTIHDIILEDDFLIANPKIFFKAKDILEEKRFCYPKNKFLIEEINECLSYFNNCSSLSRNQIEKMREEWIFSIVESHNLPSAYYDASKILSYLENDYICVSFLFSKEENVRISASKMMASLYWLTNTYPDIFKEEILAEESSLLIGGEMALSKARMLADFCKTPESGAKRYTRRAAKNLLKALDLLEPQDYIYQLSIIKRYKK